MYKKALNSHFEKNIHINVRRNYLKPVFSVLILAPNLHKKLAVNVGFIYEIEGYFTY